MTRLIELSNREPTDIENCRNAVLVVLHKNPAYLQAAAKAFELRLQATQFSIGPYECFVSCEEGLEIYAATPVVDSTATVWQLSITQDNILLTKTKRHFQQQQEGTALLSNGKIIETIAFANTLGQVHALLPQFYTEVFPQQSPNTQ